MGFLSNISVYKKLVLMQLITALSVVLITAVTFVALSYTSTIANKQKSLKSIAKVIGSNAVAPIIFKDSEGANEILNDLKVETDVTNASILDTSLHVFAYYSKQGAIFIPFNKIPKQEIIANRDGNAMYVYYKIIKDTEWLGTVCLKADLSELNNELYSRIKIAIWIVLIAALIAYLISMYLQKYITKPINKLVKITENITETNNYNIRSTLNGKDEIGKMAVAFNKMLDQIENHSNDLSETNNQLEARVKSRTEKLEERNEQLIAATALAEQSKLAKDQFLASMSHEIRTPLNAIIGFQTLLKDTPLNKDQQEYVESIDFAGKNLLVIINDILDLSKIEAGKFTFNAEDLNIEQALTSAIELVKFKADEKNISINFNHDKTIPKNLVGDAARFNQIVLNLLGNAVKFTDKGFVNLTSKLIETNKEYALCEFEIKDTGIGIANNKLDEVFESFSQASSETTRRFGGTGLGLTIVKNLLKLQGGNVSVKSEEGKGSTFTFYLKFEIDNGRIIKSNKLEFATFNNIVFDKNKNLNILLVEDTLLNQRLVKKIVEKWGYQLSIANNGVEALELHKTNTFDIILMDIQMPEMDGYTTTQHIRAFENVVKSTIPIIALTAHASQEEAEKCVSLGMNTYISKPFNPDFLRNAILQLTSKNLLKPVNNLSNVVNLSNQLYDLTYLKDHADGDYVFLVDMINTFLTDTPDFIHQLKQDIAEEDFQKIKITSHSMKGLFLTLGMNDAAKYLKEIETMSVTKTPISLIESNFLIIEKLFTSAKSPLESELEEFKKLLV